MNFELEFDGQVLRGDQVCDSDADTDLLFLHGAGNSCRDRFKPLRSDLHNSRGISSTAFDYLGHGDSSSSSYADCLEYRTDQVKSVISHCYKGGPVSIVASSMSAYIALKLLKHYAISNLVLIVPAVYNRNSFTAKFGSEFSKIIRRKNSWINSDAWEILESYTGNLLIVSVGNDQVIPKETANYLYDVSINARIRRRFEIKESSHQILGFINNHREYVKQLSKETHRLINE